MTRGRKPKNIHELVAAGTYRKGRHEGRLDLPVAAPVRPRDLDAVGRAEWDRIVPLLLERGAVSVVDTSALHALCHAWSDYMRMRKRVLKNGEIMVTPKGFEAKNPAVTIMNEAFERWRKIAVEFGLTASSRGRIRNSAKPKESANGKSRFFDKKAKGA